MTSTLLVTLIATFVADSAFPGVNARSLFCPLLADSVQHTIVQENIFNK